MLTGDLGFDDRTLIQDAHMDDTLYKNPESQHTFLDNTVEKEEEEDLNREKPMDIDLEEQPKADDLEPLPDYGKGLTASRSQGPQWSSYREVTSCYTEVLVPQADL